MRHTSTVNDSLSILVKQLVYIAAVDTSAEEGFAAINTGFSLLEPPVMKKIQSGFFYLGFTKAFLIATIPLDEIITFTFRNAISIMNAYMDYLVCML